MTPRIKKRGTKNRKQAISFMPFRGRALAGQISLDAAVENVEKLRRSALANPEAKTLTAVLGSTAKSDQTERQPAMGTCF